MDAMEAAAAIERKANPDDWMIVPNKTGGYKIVRVEKA